MFGMASGERFWQRRPFDGVLKLLESKFMVYNCTGLPAKDKTLDYIVRGRI